MKGDAHNELVMRFLMSDVSNAQVCFPRCQTFLISVRVCLLFAGSVTLWLSAPSQTRYKLSALA